MGYINKINYQYDVVVSLRWLTTSNNIYNNILNSNTYNQYSFLAFQLGIRKLDGINKKIDFLREIGIGYGSSFNFTQLVETPFSETKQKNNGTSLIAYYKTGIKFNVLKKMSLALLIQGQSDLSSRIIINNKKIKQNINQIGLAFYYNLKK